MGFGSRTISSTHPAIEILTPSEFIVSIHHHRTLSELHPPPPALLPLSCSGALAFLFLEVVLPQSCLLFPGASLSHLAFAPSVTPLGPCYRRLGLLFAVGENISTGHGRFHYSLHLRWRLPSQTWIQLPIVSTVIGSTPRLPLQVSSRCSVTATVHSLGCTLLPQLP